MTNNEAEQFVNKVMMGFWPDWNPTDAEHLLWRRKLSGYDYGRSEKALGDWLAEQDYQGKCPKIGKVLKALSARKACIVANKTRPIKVFELFDQDSPQKKQAYFVGSDKELRSRPEQSYERESEKRRQDFDSLYGGNWIVIQDWRKYFAA